MRYLLLISLIPIICGCGATLDILRDEAGKINRIVAVGAQESEIVQGDEIVRIKTTQQVIPENLISFSGIKNIAD